MSKREYSDESDLELSDSDLEISDSGSETESDCPPTAPPAAPPAAPPGVPPASKTVQKFQDAFSVFRAKFSESIKDRARRACPPDAQTRTILNKSRAVGKQMFKELPEHEKAQYAKEAADFNRARGLSAPQAHAAKRPRLAEPGGSSRITIASLRTEMLSEFKIIASELRSIREYLAKCAERADSDSE
jgi:hypothetical protein